MHTVTIQHTIVKNLTIVAKDKTKSPSSHRTFELLPEIKDMLLKQYQEMLKNKALFGNTFNDSDYVFTWEDGRPYRPDYITHTFQKVLKQKDIPMMRFHDLRHSTASILYDKGWSLKDIQTWLGQFRYQDDRQYLYPHHQFEKTINGQKFGEHIQSLILSALEKC